MQLRTLIDRPTILSLVYYDCVGICPQILSSVSDVIEKMGLELGKDYRVLTVSFNDQDRPYFACSAGVTAARRAQPPTNQEA